MSNQPTPPTQTRFHGNFPQHVPCNPLREFLREAEKLTPDIEDIPKINQLLRHAVYYLKPLEQDRLVIYISEKAQVGKTRLREALRAEKRDMCKWGILPGGGIGKLSAGALKLWMT